MNFTERQVQYPGKKRLIKVDANNIPIAGEPPILVNFERDEGAIIASGTIVNAQNLNAITDDLQSQIDTKIDMNTVKDYVDSTSQWILLSNTVNSVSSSQSATISLGNDPQLYDYRFEVRIDSSSITTDRDHWLFIRANSQPTSNANGWGYGLVMQSANDGTANNGFNIPVLCRFQGYTNAKTSGTASFNMVFSSTSPAVATLQGEYGISSIRHDTSPISYRRVTQGITNGFLRAASSATGSTTNITSLGFFIESGQTGQTWSLNIKVFRRLRES